MLYSYISALINHHQRSFLLQQVGEKIQGPTARHYAEKKGPCNIMSQTEPHIKSLLSGLKESCRRRSRVPSAYTLCFQGTAKCENKWFCVQTCLWCLFLASSPVSLFRPIPLHQFLSNLILYYHLFRCFSFFSSERQKRGNLNRREDGEALGREGDETVIRIYYVTIKSYFQ